HSQRYGPKNQKAKARQTHGPPGNSASIIRDMQGATELLPTLGLDMNSMPIAENTTTLVPSNIGDPAKVASFVPRWGGMETHTAANT
ncbi:Hypothetical predicted protein, partial [Pelobates cultripes]